MGNPEQIYRKILIGGFIFIVAFLPLLISPATFMPANFGKGIAFRITVEILLFVYILLLSRDRNYLPKLSTLDVAIIIFWVTNGLAAIFGAQPIFSLLGGLDRMGGFFTMTHLIIFYFLLKGILKNRREWNLLFHGAIATAVAVALLALAQRFGLNLLRFGIPIAGGETLRPASTIGNPNFLGAYLLFLFFLALILFFEKIRAKSMKDPAVFLCLSSIIVFSAGIISSGSKGAIAGLAGGLLLFFILFPAKIFKLRISTMALGIIIGVFILNFIAGFTNREFISIEPINKISFKIYSFMTTGSIISSIKPRLLVWQTGIEAWRERKFLGWGPENFEVAFNKHVKYPYADQFPHLSDPTSAWWDKAHNFLIDSLVTTGLLGLLSLFFILGILLYVLWQARNGLNKIFAHGLTSIFLAYFIQNLFNIEVVSTLILFYFFLAFTSQLRSYEFYEAKPRKIDPPAVPRKSLFKFGYIITVCSLVIISVYLFNLKPLFANQKINKIVGTSVGTLGMKGGGPEAAELYRNYYSQIIKASNYFAFEGNLQNIIWFQENYGEVLEKQNKNEGAKEVYEEAIALLEKQKRLQPKSPRIYLTEGGVYLKLAALDEKYKERAIESYLKSRALRPTYPESYLQFGKLAITDHDYKKAQEYFGRAYAISPINKEVNWWLGISYVLNGMALKAQTYLWTSGKLQDKNSLEYLTLVYAQTKNYKYLAGVYETLILFEPQNPQLYASLAASYKELEEFKKARDAALKILEIKPELEEQVKEFLKTLPSF